MGTTIFWPLARQFGSKDEVEQVDEFADSVTWLIMPCLLLVIPVITAGSLLPFWVFINSLQIISHMVLLNTIMPANAHFFLKKWNDWIRWYDSSFWEYLKHNYDFKEYEKDTGSYSPLLWQSDYTHLFA